MGEHDLATVGLCGRARSRGFGNCVREHDLAAVGLCGRNLIKKHRKWEGAGCHHPYIYIYIYILYIYIYIYIYICSLVLYNTHNHTVKEPKTLFQPLKPLHWSASPLVCSTVSCGSVGLRCCRRGILKMCPAPLNPRALNASTREGLGFQG